MEQNVSVSQRRGRSFLLTMLETSLLGLLFFTLCPVTNADIASVVMTEAYQGKVRITTSIKFTCRINWRDSNNKTLKAINLMFKDTDQAQPKVCASYDSDATPVQIEYIDVSCAGRTIMLSKVTLQEYTIEISDAKLSDQKQFYCQAFLAFSKLFPSETLKIDVQVPPQKPSLQLSDTGALVVGESLTITCLGNTGKPQGRFIWYETLVNSQGQLGSETQVNDATSTELPQTNGTFFLRETYTINSLLVTHNQAKYRCAANNQAVDVSNGEANPSVDMTLNVLYDVKTPAITSNGVTENGVTVIQAGSDIRCTAQANPAPTYLWTKIQGPSDLTSSQGVLNVPRDAKLGKYQYRCNANNDVDGTTAQKTVDFEFEVSAPVTTPKPTKKPETESSTKAPDGGDPDKNTEPEGGVDTAGIAGGVVGAILAIILIVIIVFCVCRNKKKDEDTEKGHKGHGLDNGPIGGFDVEVDDGRPYGNDPYAKQSNGGAFPIEMVDNTPGSRKAFHVPADPNGFERAYM